MARRTPKSTDGGTPDRGSLDDTGVLMKVLTVVGARPQFIKAAAMMHELESTPGITHCLTHTGQHYDADMSEVFFTELGIPRPQHHLHAGSGPHGEQTGRMLEALERVLQEERPDWVLVYGDTNSTLAGALAAAKLHIPVAHVEAGLRSFNRRMPEEINRVVTDQLASLLFAPTRLAVANLKREGIAGNHVLMTGDVMYDAAMRFGRVADEHSDVLERVGASPRSYILCSVHRAETTDDPRRLRAVFDGLIDLARQYNVILPLHPRTRAALQKHDLLARAEATLSILGPVGYLDMLKLEQNALVIATDSGGVQKEAYFCRVPCVTLRDETEWVELVEEGWNTVVPPLDVASVVAGVQKSIGTKGTEHALYGGGRASAVIAKALQEAR